MPLDPTPKKKARENIASTCRNAVANEPRIHYSQKRPFQFVDHIETGWHTLDCSGFVINCFWNAMHDLALYISDPSGQWYSGYGNTWTMQTWLSKFGKKVATQGFLVGDIALYDGHTTICSKSGDAKTSVWTSHGSEGGPVTRTLHYRPDFVGVWRHPALL